MPLPFPARRPFLAWLFARLEGHPDLQACFWMSGICTKRDAERMRVAYWGLRLPDGWSDDQVHWYYIQMLVVGRRWGSVTYIEGVDAIHQYCHAQRHRTNDEFNRLQGDVASFHGWPRFGV